MTTARKEGAEKPAPKPKAERPSVGFRGLIDQFKKANPEAWEDIRLTPTQSGVEAIAEALEKL